MPDKEESSFDIAAEKAGEDLQKKLQAMTPEQKAGALILSQWWKANFMQAGHKRLGRIVANLK